MIGLLVQLMLLLNLSLIIFAQSRRQKSTTTTPPSQDGPSILSPPTTNKTSPTREEINSQTDDDDSVVRVNSNLIPLQASVVDESGRVVTDLKLEDFELTVDGDTQPLREMTRSELPVRLTMLFDNSSSLNPAREFQKKAAVRFFKRVVRPIDEAAIFSISTVPELSQPMTSDVKQLTRVIEDFRKPKGATAMLDTIIQAADYLRLRQGRKVIVIVSDGADTISEHDFESTQRAVQAANCQVYAVQTGQYENANLRDLTAERRLQQLAAQTGGAMYVPLKTADLDNAFAQISADLAQQYVLSYYPSNEKRDGRYHAVTLRVKTREHLRVRTRKGYYAPKGK